MLRVYLRKNKYSTGGAILPPGASQGTPGAMTLKARSGSTPMAELTRLFINGAWVVGEAGTREKRSQRDGRVLAEGSQATEAQVQQAIQAARSAVPTSYRQAPAYQRL